MFTSILALLLLVKLFLKSKFYAAKSFMYQTSPYYAPRITDAIIGIWRYSDEVIY